MDQYIGKMLDNRYEILECVGTGGMAVVYKARCHRLNRLVALKILKPELASDADFRRRFQVESQAVAMLSHANIVSVYDVSHSDGLDYIVMELIDGMTLKQYMQKRGTPLNWREALHFITQIVRALGHAHSRGIVHRDIKPHNIMVLRDGSVKVADFGIARLASAAHSTLTQEALGSVHYISPEQAKGSHVDGRSDLYSAGVVLYEMLTGRLPFEGETPVFVAIQHINSTPLAPRDLNPDIPEALEAITMKAMAPKLDQRYSSADSMLEDLKEFRKNPGAAVVGSTPDQTQEDEEPTMVIPVDELSSLEKSTQGGRRLGQNKGSAADSEEPTHHGGNHSKEADRSSRRNTIIPILVAALAVLLFLGGIAYFLSTVFRGMSDKPPELVVPDLRGYTVEELQQNPSLLNGFEIVVDSTVFNEEYDENEICAQDPAPNETVKKGNMTITVTLSGGKDKNYMFDLYAKDAREVLKILQDEWGVKVIQREEYDDTISEGFIISYTPIVGTLLEPGDEVTIVISKGRETKSVQVTNFVGVDIDQVKSRVVSMGLEIGKVEEFHSDKYEAGQVIWQSIPEGTPVEAGTVINFQVSKGPEPAPEPTPSDEVSPPSEDVNPPTSTRTITVDLSGYEGSVSVRIIVGSTTVRDSAVDSSLGVLTHDVMGSGSQPVSIYINNILVDSYTLQF